MDLERRVQNILRNGNAPRQRDWRGGQTSTALVFVIGILVGVLATMMCAPMHATKTGSEHQPWRIRYTTSDEA